MYEKILFYASFCLIVCLCACHGDKGKDGNEQFRDETAFHGVGDSVKQEAPVLAVDGDFDDFLYTFCTDARFRSTRVRPEMCGNSTQFFEMTDSSEYDVLFCSTDDIARVDTMLSARACVERVDLNGNYTSLYTFCPDSLSHKWYLCDYRVREMEEHPMHDFLAFYGEFVNNTDFRDAHMAEDVTVSMYMPGMDEPMQGTLDPDQLSSFNVEFPRSPLVLVHYGQKYQVDADSIILRRALLSNSVMEHFTFRRDGDTWIFTSYEN